MEPTRAFLLQLLGVLPKVCHPPILCLVFIQSLLCFEEILLPFFQFVYQSYLIGVLLDLFGLYKLIEHLEHAILWLDGLEINIGKRPHWHHPTQPLAIARHSRHAIAVYAGHAMACLT